MSSSGHGRKEDFDPAILVKIELHVRPSEKESGALIDDALWQYEQSYLRTRERYTAWARWRTHGFVVFCVSVVVFVCAVLGGRDSSTGAERKPLQASATLPLAGTDWRDGAAWQPTYDVHLAKRLQDAMCRMGSLRRKAVFDLLYPQPDDDGEQEAAVRFFFACDAFEALLDHLRSNDDTGIDDISAEQDFFATRIANQAIYLGASVESVVGQIRRSRSRISAHCSRRSGLRNTETMIVEVTVTKGRASARSRGTPSSYSRCVVAELEKLHLGFVSGSFTVGVAIR